ncbi:hypothetical protein Pla175_07270 [Pirellulimonas nuda]|uniref:Uncharacterized protein n=1 Tax=Pirellulimonas nuda TaxID=2528009 RepID=A0A518D7A5_9BACT|nr:hypothetical protein [Pirellulimonas nuda]QDU87368.1 hypothetical protein Pla175_07270 [Pirellulimonas nuda]
MKNDEANADPRALRLAALLARRAEVLRSIDDCEAYLQSCASFTSDEEQHRTARDIDDYREALATLEKEIERMRKDSS